MKIDRVLTLLLDEEGNVLRTKSVTVKMVVRKGDRVHVEYVLEFEDAAEDGRTYVDIPVAQFGKMQ